MFDTMYEANGVGLAAPQVGVLRRIVVIDVMDGNPLCLVNPEIVETSGGGVDWKDVFLCQDLREKFLVQITLFVRHLIAICAQSQLREMACWHVASVMN